MPQRENTEEPRGIGLPSAVTSGSLEPVCIGALILINITALYIPVPTPVELIVYVICTLYIATFRSLLFFSVVERPPQPKEGEDPSSVKKNPITMGKSEVWTFPIVASCVLFGLYMFYKWNILNWELTTCLNIYFGYLGTLGVQNAFKGFAMQGEGFRNMEKKTITDIQTRFDWLKIHLSLLDIIGFVVAIFIVTCYFMTKHWLANNIIAVAFCIYGIENMYFGKFLYAYLLLILLFIYDIFWVFYTEVMVTVATSLELPIKLLFFKSYEIPDDPTTKSKFSMLGLGDIVIPGLLIALCLRFDVINQIKGKLLAKGETLEIKASDLVDVLPKSGKEIKQPYFWCCMFGYLVGIVTTLYVMYVFEAPQPALLYLVPGCCFPIIIMAAVRGELGKMFAWNEEEEAIALLPPVGGKAIKGT